MTRGGGPPGPPITKSARIREHAPADCGFPLHRVPFLPPAAGFSDIMLCMKVGIWILALLILSACAGTQSSDSIHDLQKRVENLEQENESLKEQQSPIPDCPPNHALSLDNTHCVKIPDHAHAVESSTDVWLCDEGYIEVGSKCILKSISPPVAEPQINSQAPSRVPTSIAAPEQRETFPAYGRIICVPTRGVFCSGGSCSEREPTVGLVIDLDSDTASRCDDQGCDTYDVVFDRSGIFVNIHRPYQGGWNVKMNISDMSYTEVAELLLDQYISYGVCQEDS